MGLAGNIRTFPFAEVVQTLHRINATGVLRLVAGEVSREVVVKNGQIIGVAFPLGQERQALLARLVMQGHLDAADAASMSAGSTASQVIAALIENSLVTDQEVNEAARLQAEEELYHIFTWPAADFSFTDANAPSEGERGTETYKKVDHHASSQLALNLNSVLMEAARRADEWTQVKGRLTDPAAVPGPVEGREAELKAAGAEFPAAAVVPLIDAIRSIDDIVAAAVVTRLDVYAELDSLATAGMITWLSRDDLIAHADWLAANHESSKAADLYRKALARDGRDAATGRKLAATLEQLGDAVEGAASWAQLAIAALEVGDAANARDLAERAVSLAPTDVRWRTLLAKVLASSGDAAGAVGEYIMLAAQHTEAGRWEDARANALTVLAIRAGELRAVRVLARIAIATASEPGADGTRPCPACGAKQDSDANVCSSCRVPLQLPCRACNALVSVHDAICTVCAADPHAEASTLLVSRQERGGVTQVAKSIAAAVAASAGDDSRTSVAVRQPGEGGGASSAVMAWREQLDGALAKAQAIEESGDWEGALVAWRVVAALQPDNQALTAHIREIEDHLHEAAIEAAIGRGHQGRRTRQYFKAVAAYRQALRLMGAKDPRAMPVGESLRKAEKARTRLTAMYGLAGVVLLAIGAFAANPYIKSHRFHGDLAVVRNEVAALSDVNRIATISTEIDGLTERAAEMRGAFGSSAKQDLDAVNGDFFVAQNLLASASLAAIRADLAARNVIRAQAQVESYTATFRPEFWTPAFEECRTRLTALKAELKLSDDATKIGPAKLEAAKKLEEDNRLAEALVAFRALSTNLNPAVAPVAVEAVGRLEPRSTAFTAAWNSAIAAVAVDLARAERLDQLLAEARLWGRETELKRLREDAAGRLATAEKDWKALDLQADPARLEAFIAAHPGAPQVEPAKTRLAALQNRLAHRDEAIASQRALLAASRWEQAWQAGQDLITGYAGLIDPSTIELPLVVQSVPSGAKVLRDGKALGTTPFTIRYQAGSAATCAIEAAGWQPGAVVLPAAAAAWQTTVVLTRIPAWTVALGKPASNLIVGPRGQLNVISREGLALVVAGQVRWQAPLAGDDLAAGDHPDRAATLLQDGTMAIALPVSGVALIGADGKAKGRIATTAEVRGRPLDYVNEVFGPQARLAIAADTLRTGSLGGETLTIPLPSPAISGPISFLKDLDRVLVVADVEGRLTAIEESTRKTLWRLDLQASDCNHLKALGGETVVAVLDGVRLSAWSVLPQPALLWTVRLPGSAVGEPVIDGNLVHIAAGSAVLTVASDGSQRAPQTLPSPAATGLASDGKLSAVGCSDGTLVVIRDGTITWTTPLGHRPAAVAICAGQVVAALDDGSILAFAP